MEIFLCHLLRCHDGSTSYSVSRNPFAKPNGIRFNDKSETKERKKEFGDVFFCTINP